MKVRVPVIGTIGKNVQFDPEAGARAEAAVAALSAQIAAGVGGSIRHSVLLGLQVGDDHPQYTGNAFPETITGLWNFSTIPLIQGDSLAEYIEDVVGGTFFDFLQDTTSVVWTYHETANELEANVPPEFVQDTVGAMLTDTSSIDLSYNDSLGTFTAAIIDEYVQDLVGAMLVDTSTVDFTYDDVLGQISATVPGAALSKVDDTNVTLALGGNFATALARAASLTLGWTGQLAVARGGSGAATLTGYLKGNGTAAFTASASIPYSDISGTPTIPAGANPSASVGLAAVNGSATSFMRSDGAPALDQTIAPTMSGFWTFSNAKLLFTAGGGTTGGYLANAPTLPKASLDSLVTGVGNFYTERLMRVIRSNAPVFGGLAFGAALTGSPAAVAADTSLVDFRGSGYFSTTLTDFADGMSFQAFSAETWSSTARGSYMTIGLIPVTTTSQAECFRLSPTVARFPRDNQELQLGASQDLRLFHDGTDSWVRNDTGILKLSSGATSVLEVTAARGTFNVPFRSKAYTVATLPAGAQGDRAHVTDALAPVFLGIIAGGGAVITPVFHNGTNWVAD